MTIRYEDMNPWCPAWAGDSQASATIHAMQDAIQELDNKMQLLIILVEALPEDVKDEYTKRVGLHTLKNAEL